jgi:hypothetical protein
MRKVIIAWKERSPNAATLFASPGGEKPLSRHTINSQARKVQDRLKLPWDCVLHSCRHTFGSTLGMSGADVFTIQLALGYASVTMTQRYVHPTSNALKNAVRGMLNLDRVWREQSTSRIPDIPRSTRTAKPSRKPCHKTYRNANPTRVAKFPVAYPVQLAQSVFRLAVGNSTARGLFRWSGVGQRANNFKFFLTGLIYLGYKACTFNRYGVTGHTLIMGTGAWYFLKIIT